MTTCPRCRSEIPPRATYCPTCGACLDTLPASDFETRERELHEQAYRDAIVNMSGDRSDRRQVLAAMRSILADPEGCGSRYCHSVACRVLDEGEKGHV